VRPRAPPERDLVLFSGKAKLPSAHLESDQRLAGELDPEAVDGEHPAVVEAASLRPMKVDRAPVPDEHRTAAVLVTARQEVAARELRRRKEHLTRYVRERVCFVGFNVHKLGGATSCGARAAGHT
jgi:predicted nucleic acid-binding Zn ribbon protein